MSVEDGATVGSGRWRRPRRDGRAPQARRAGHGRIDRALRASYRIGTARASAAGLPTATEGPL